MFFFFSPQIACQSGLYFFFRTEVCEQYKHKLCGGELPVAVKLMNVRTGWGWKYFGQSAVCSQKNPEQVVQRPRFKSHSCHVWGVVAPGKSVYKCFQL